MSDKHHDYGSLIQQSVINTIHKLQHHLSEPETSTEYIHRIRVDIKHFRAWLRLLRLSNNHHHWKHIDQHLFEYAKQLGSTRDAQAIKETLDILSNYSKTKEERSAITYVQKQLSLLLITPSINWKEFKKRFLTELIIIEKEFISFGSITVLKNGLKHTYSKTKKLGMKAFSEQRSYNDLHKFRKWVKYLNYQLGYLNKRINIKHDIDTLGDALGKAHDLIIIKEKIERLKKNKQINAVSKLIDKNISLILENSRNIYINVFCTSSEKFVDKFNFN
jgi:CHAD domain-containing protein